MALEDATNPMQGVSGPSTFSKRTDLEYQSQSYGDGVKYDAEKSGAPLARAPKSPLLSQAPQVPAGGMPAPTGVGLFEPTQRPGEEVTTGVDVGPGAGSNALMMGKSIEKLSDTLAKMLPYDTDGSIAILYQDALARGN
jgi:hypothetical protein